MSDVKDRDETPKKDQEQGKEDVQKDLEEILGKLSESENKAAQPEKKPAEKSEEPPEPVKEPTPSASEEEPESLEGILDKISEKEEPPEELSVFQRIWGIFVKPVQVFEYLRVKPDFLVPLILIILVSVAVNLKVYDIAIQDQIAKIEENDRIPDEQKDLIIDRMEESRHGTKRIINSFVVPPVSVLIIFALVSAIFLFIGNILLGGKARFAQIFSIYCYSYLIITIAGTIVKLPLWLAKQTMQVETSLALLVPETASKTLHNILSSFDIFTLWFLVVFGIGFAVIYRFSQLKGILSVFIAWFIWVLITKVALASVLGGLI